MYIPEKGVLKNSRTYFNTPSNTAVQMFFYLKCAGHFFCNQDYYLKRDSYNSYLLMFVKQGKGFVNFEKKNTAAKANDLILLDCYKPHAYYTNEGWEIQWLHFDGNLSRQFVELLNSRFGCVISMENTLLVQKYFSLIIDSCKSSKLISEPLVSCYIHRILSEMLTLTAGIPSNEVCNNSIVETISYIQSNFDKKLTITELANNASLSVFHFSRLFKKETGYSPYEYIMKTRIDHSKMLLKKTKQSIKEIAYLVGFTSESNFVSTFHKNVSMTPEKFRNTPI